MDECMLHGLMVRTGFVPVMNRSRVHLQAARDHPSQEDPSLVVWFTQEVWDCVQTNPNQPPRGSMLRGSVQPD